AICREPDLSETAVRHWVGQAAVDAGERDGLTTEEREELRRLRRENKVLRDERDILKRATSSRWRPDEPVPVRRGGEGSVSGDAVVPDGAGLPRRLLPVAGGNRGSAPGRGRGADGGDSGDPRRVPWTVWRAACARRAAGAGPRCRPQARRPLDGRGGAARAASAALGPDDHA